MIKVREIAGLVAVEAGFTLDELVGRQRYRELVEVRQLAMWLARRCANASLPRIGRDLGGRHHTTVLDGLAAIEDKLTDDARLRALAGVVIARVETFSARMDSGARPERATLYREMADKARAALASCEARAALPTDQRALAAAMTRGQHVLAAAVKREAV